MVLPASNCTKRDQMKFTDVQLVLGLRHKNTPEEQQLFSAELERSRYLMHYWENVRNIFCLNIPKRSDLGGISKLNVKFGEFEGDAFLFPGDDGIATYRRNDFDFDEFQGLSDKDKDLESLQYLEDSLLQTCEYLSLGESSKHQIRQIADSVRQQNFEFSKVHKKTSKWNTSRSLRAVTKLHFKKGGVDAELTVSDRDGNVVLRELIIDSQLWESVWYDLWKGFWEDSAFVIEDRVGSKFYRTADES